MSRIDHYTVNDKDIFKVVPDIAPSFDETTAYSVGDYVVKDAVLYKFISDHAAGSWDSSEVKAEDVSTAINSLGDIIKTFLRNGEENVSWVRGALSSSTGGPTTSNASKRCRTGSITLKNQVVSSDEITRFTVYFYSGGDSSNNYLGKTDWLTTCDIRKCAEAKGYLTADRFKLLGSYRDDGMIGDGTSDDISSVASRIYVNDTYIDNIKELTSSDDLDAVQVAGTYFYGSASIPDNAPCTTGGMIVVNTYSDRYFQQTYTNVNNDTYFRFHGSAGFSKWKHTGYDKTLLQFSVSKGAWNPSGRIATNVLSICCSNKFELEPGSVLNFYIDDNWDYSIREGDASNALSNYTAVHSKSVSHVVTHKYVAINFLRYENGEAVNTLPEDFDDNIVIRTSGNAIYTAEDKYHDFPETQGQMNVINRAYQMSRFSFETLATLPMHNGGSITVTPKDAPAGSLIKGVPYSSMRETMASVPNATSFHAFMTAALNPNSYLYTKHYEGTAPGYNYNSRCYYGAVCSTLVAYCYGIDDVIPTTISFANYTGLNPLPQNQQNPYSLKLADMLNDPGNHIVIVTDIIRNNRGKVTSIEVTEAWKPLCRSVTYSTAEIISRYFNDGFIAYRYEGVDDVTYEEDPWVHIDDSETGTPTYCTSMCPRKGDKANWSVGETVEIDILDDVADWSTYSIVDRNAGSIILTASVPSTGLISIANALAGEYRVYLTKDGINSASVYYSVIDHEIHYTPMGSHKVKVEFSSTYGTPSAIYWCCNIRNDSDYKAARAYYILQPADLSAGEVVIDEPVDHRNEDTVDGVWLMRMCFKTPFGLFASELEPVQVT